MPKYSDKPCARCGKMMLHAYCSQRYCKACAPLVHSDDAIQTAQQTCHERDCPRGTCRQGRRYQLRRQYVARYDPPKARPKPQKERYHDL